jgi:hypothetical protein
MSRATSGGYLGLGGPKDSPPLRCYLAALVSRLERQLHYTPFRRSQATDRVGWEWVIGDASTAALCDQQGARGDISMYLSRVPRASTGNRDCDQWWRSFRIVAINSTVPTGGMKALAIDARSRM